MTCTRAGLALLALTALVSAAPAHGFGVPFGPGGFSFGGFGAGFGGHNRHAHFGGRFGGFGHCATPYFFYPVYSPPVPNISVVQQYYPPPPPPIILGRGDLAGLADVLNRPAPQQRIDNLGDPDMGRVPVRPAPRPPAKPPGGKLPDLRPPELPKPKPPDADPKAENARLVKLGREAFAAGEYGRAAERFRQATLIDPAEPLAHFLLAQALVALGKYEEAVEAIHAGMRLDPDWPSAKFRPAELYDARAAELAEHLRRLDEALARHPDDAVLLFLNAYQLWFDGRHGEARPLFRRAAALAPDRSFSERFLLARPGS
jgi:hypothetical protein